MRIRSIKHVRGFDVARPISIRHDARHHAAAGAVAAALDFHLWIQQRPGTFLSSLVAPEAIFALKLSIVTSFWATVFNVVFGLFAAYVLSRYDFWGRNAVIVTISLPTAIPTAVAGFALLLLWGNYGTIGRLFLENQQIMFTPYAIILANIFVTFPLAFGVIKPVFDTMSRSLEEASATIGATRWQTFWYVTLPSLRGAIVSGALLTFARAVGEFGSTILVSGNLCRPDADSATIHLCEIQRRTNRSRECDCDRARLTFFVIFSVLFFARDWLEFETQEA